MLSFSRMRAKRSARVSRVIEESSRDTQLKYLPRGVLKPGKASHDRGGRDAVEGPVIRLHKGIQNRIIEGFPKNRRS